jgi:predicted Zn-dependent protease
LKAPPEDIALERALWRAQLGELDGVERDLIAKVENKHRDSVLILEALAQGYAETFRLGKARRALDEWLERQPKSAAAFFRRAELYRPLYGQDTWGFGRGNSEGAAADYREVLEINPDHYEARLHLAVLLVDSHRPDEALRHFQYLQNRRGKEPDVRLGLAHCRLQLGEVAEAQKLLEALLKEYPRHVAALTTHGKLALQAGRPAEAEASLRKAAAASPNDYEVHYRLYQCLLQQAKKQEAKQQFVRLKRAQAEWTRVREVTEAILKNPADPALRLELGNILLRLGKAPQGLRWLQSALREDPHHRPTHQALADYYEHAGDRELAARHRRLAAPEDKQKQP